MSENPRRGRQARNFTTNVPKILDLKSSSEQIFFRKLSLGAPEDKTWKTQRYQRDKHNLSNAAFTDFTGWQTTIANTNKKFTPSV